MMYRFVLFVVFSFLMVSVGGQSQAANLAGYDCSAKDIPSAECDALVDLYISTNGSGWTNGAQNTQSGWLDAGVGSGVICDNRYGVYCAANSVDSLALGDNNLSGELPDRWYDLLNLTQLSMSDSRLSGDLPSTLASLSSLRRLSLENIYDANFDYPNLGLSGDLFSVISGLSLLEYLGFGDSSHLLVTIPADIGLWYPNLVSLGLSRLKFNSTIPVSLCSLSLINLTLSSASDDIQDSFLSGSLPSCISGMTGLIDLNIRSNQLYGTLPDLSLLTGLESLNLSVGYENMAAINLDPILITRTWPTFQSFPDYIQNFSGLKSLTLNGFNFQGLSLPTWLPNLTGLKFVRLGGGLVGPIPESYAQMTGLVTLDLGFNSLNGTIPEWLTGFSSMTDLRLIGNCFTTYPYSTDLVNYLDQHNGSFLTWTGQSDCSDLSLGGYLSSGTTSLLLGSDYEYTLEYGNEGINNTPVSSLSFLYDNDDNSVVSFVTGSRTMVGGTLSQEKYGIPGDSCFDDFVGFPSTGVYLTNIELALGTSLYDALLEDIPTLQLGDEGSALWNDLCQANGFDDLLSCIEQNVQADIGDPSCTSSVTVIETFFSMSGSLLPGETGFATFRIQPSTTGMHMGSWSIFGSNVEEFVENNVFDTFAFDVLPVPIQAVPEQSSGGGGGSSSVTTDTCPNGDNSGSYYDGKCDGENPQIKPQEEIVHPASILPKLKINQIEKKLYTEFCKYNDLKSTNIDFMDVVGTQYTSAVAMMVKHCLVQGYNNDGKELGIKNPLKRGELYKVFTRLGLLDFDLDTPGLGWSRGYKTAGDTVGLWNGINMSVDQDALVTQKELLQVTMNYLKYMGILDEVSMTGGKEILVTRGEFAKFINIVLGLVSAK